jgi:RNase P subunit RPR2
MLCPKCKRISLVLLGPQFRGLGSAERMVVDYWCFHCKTIHYYEVKKAVGHG